MAVAADRMRLHHQGLVVEHCRETEEDFDGRKTKAGAVPRSLAKQSHEESKQKGQTFHLNCFSTRGEVVSAQWIQLPLDHFAMLGELANDQRFQLQSNRFPMLGGLGDALESQAELDVQRFQLQSNRFPTLGELVGALKSQAELEEQGAERELQLRWQYASGLDPLPR